MACSGLVAASQLKAYAASATTSRAERIGFARLTAIKLDVFCLPVNTLKAEKRAELAQKLARRGRTL